MLLHPGLNVSINIKFINGRQKKFSSERLCKCSILNLVERGFAENRKNIIIMKKK